jgi:rare lipoprotein A
MKRWLVLLGLLMAQCPNAAEASTRAAEPSLWQKLVHLLTPTPQPQVHRGSVRVASRRHSVVGVTPAAPLASEPPAVAVRPAPEPPAPPEIPILSALPALLAPEKSAETKAGKGCNGGTRIISAYYWEGHHTASGEPFNPQGMTAAHRTLPFGTHLTVTNPRTGQSVTVVINDRGPYVHGVTLDLSLGAARAIGLHGTGAVCI